MSEYLSKKAVLECLEKKWDAACRREEDYYIGKNDAYRDTVLEIQSGAFDADNSEVQRLRAALVEIKQLLNENRENDGAFQSWNHMQAWKVATQALSTTTEPINAEKVERVREGDGNDA